MIRKDHVFQHALGLKKIKSVICFSYFSPGLPPRLHLRPHPKSPPSFSGRTNYLGFMRYLYWTPGCQVKHKKMCLITTVFFDAVCSFCKYLTWETLRLPVCLFNIFLSDLYATPTFQPVYKRLLNVQYPSYHLLLFHMQSRKKLILSLYSALGACTYIRPEPLSLLALNSSQPKLHATLSPENFIPQPFW